MTGSADGSAAGKLSSARTHFADSLTELFAAAGNPTLDQVFRATRSRFPAARRLPPVQRISDWRSGRAVPARFASFEPVLDTLTALARQHGTAAGSRLVNRIAWQRLWNEANAEARSDRAPEQPLRASPLPLPRPAVTDTLPRDIDTLIGREPELQRILDLAATGPAVSIYTIDGMPGVGKTALATRAAHRLAERYPDGRFFVNLHAHTSGHSAATPTEVLAGLLTDLGVDPRNVPDTLESRRNMWRNQVAGKRILLVLDDARDHDQVEPLLPNGPGCLTLITSRRRLVALDGSLPLALDTLDPEKAAELFATLARRPASDGDGAAMADIARLCGYLPLAIVLLAGRLAHHTAWTIPEAAADFAAAQDRLSELEAGERAVRAAFTMSYRDLPPHRQRLFRLLSAHPGPDIDSYAAAVLAGSTETEARRELEVLFTDHLIEEPARGRYRMHDLLREYARALPGGDDDEHRAAVDRLLDHYQRTGERANWFLVGGPRPQPGTGEPESDAAPRFTTAAAALTWMRAERGNLLSCLEYGAAHHQPARVIGLTSALAGLLRLDGPWPLAIRLHRRAATHAEHSDDRVGQAAALLDLGTVRYATGDYPGTESLARQALAVYRGLGERAGEARCLSILGRLGYATGDYPGTADLMRRALAIYQEVGDGLGEAYALIGLGVVRYATGDYPGTVSLVEQALGVFQEIDDRSGEAYALNELGVVHYATGDYAGAVTALEQARALSREIDDRFGIAYALNDLVAVRFAMGDYPGAAELTTVALRNYREVGDRWGEAYALSNLGRVSYATGDCSDASVQMGRALAMFEDIGDRVGQAYVLSDLGLVRYSTGDYSGAVDRMEQALAIFLDIGDRVGQAYTLIELGLLAYADGGYPRADERMQQALTIFREIGDRVGQAYALSGLGRLSYVTDDVPGGIDRLQQALGIFREIGDRVGQAYALSSLGRLRYASGDLAGTDTLVHQAKSIFEEIGDRFGHAFSLAGLTLLHGAADDFVAATGYAQQALAIFREIGDRVSQGYTFIGLGLLRYQAGDYAGAAELVQQAPMIFREIGDRLGEAYAFMGLGLVRYKVGDYSGGTDLVQQALAIFRDVGERPGQTEMLDRISNLWDEYSPPQNPVASYIDTVRLVREIQIRWKRRRVWRDLPVPVTPR
ncbi:tetratricopeptide repeat protein [Nocardia aurantia]|uniref:Photosystem I assembly protein Ycf3 n=1 Tax=Nocardia aurantia TaxID=2585199 RepID=A0A7K0DUX8_9NOCA|nr:tetratricopeptide repeat protein [Nocardia aurantia]MQY29182.1 Photosystem I assembly protein Ycf3 [Nocardia aurantia]